MADGLDPEGFPVEADRFAEVLDLDFSVESVAKVQAALKLNRSDPAVIGAGCYVGEVLRRTLGGAWQPDGTLAGLGRVTETSPLAKARAGEDLVAYVNTVLAVAR